MLPARRGAPASSQLRLRYGIRGTSCDRSAAMRTPDARLVHVGAGWSVIAARHRWLGRMADERRRWVCAIAMSISTLISLNHPYRVSTRIRTSLAGCRRARTYPRPTGWAASRCYGPRRIRTCASVRRSAPRRSIQSIIVDAPKMV